MFVGKLLGQKGDDGGGFGQHGVVCFERGNFAHRIDCQIVGGFHGFAERNQFDVVLRAAFFQHPDYVGAAGIRVGVERETVHGVSPAGLKRPMIQAGRVNFCQQAFSDGLF